jgi:hypothetical protein
MAGNRELREILLCVTLFTPRHRTRAEPPRKIFKATIDGLLLFGTRVNLAFCNANEWPNLLK